MIVVWEAENFYGYQECSRRFPVRIHGIESMVKTEKFQLISSSNSMNDQLKVFGTLSGDTIAHAVGRIFHCSR